MMGLPVASDRHLRPVPAFGPMNGRLRRTAGGNLTSGAMSFGSVDLGGITGGRRRCAVGGRLQCMPLAYRRGECYFATNNNQFRGADRCASNPYVWRSHFAGHWPLAETTSVSGRLPAVPSERPQPLSPAGRLQKAPSSVLQATLHTASYIPVVADRSDTRLTNNPIQMAVQVPPAQQKAFAVADASPFSDFALQQRTLHVQ